MRVCAPGPGPFVQARKDQKLENKKAKREKKLLRAGFEGRKEGFIGGAAKPAAAK